MVVGINPFRDHFAGHDHPMVRTIDDITSLDEAAIIPFKGKAWLDLSARRDAAERVDEQDIKKHRNDVARLLQLLRPEAPLGGREQAIFLWKATSSGTPSEASPRMPPNNCLF